MERAVCQQQLYGISAAQVSGLPPQVLTIAREVCHFLLCATSMVACISATQAINWFVLSRELDYRILDYRIRQTAKEITQRQKLAEAQYSKHKQEEAAAQVTAVKVELLEQLFALKGSELTQDGAALRSHMGNLRANYRECLAKLSPEA
jgi:uncharacterized protein (DUF3084 family)